MPGRGLEPLRISPPDPKSGASANFATLAIGFLILDLRFAIARSAGFPASYCRSRQRLTPIAMIASARPRTKLPAGYAGVVFAAAAFAAAAFAAASAAAFFFASAAAAASARFLSTAAASTG